MTRTILVQICYLILLIFKIPATAGSTLHSTKDVETEAVFSQQALFRREKKTYLMNHVYERKQADSEFNCSLYCVGDGFCGSVNYKTSGIGRGLCELNNKTTQERSEVEKISDPEVNHHSKIKRVSKLHVIYVLYTILRSVFSFTLTVKREAFF